MWSQLASPHILEVLKKLHHESRGMGKLSKLLVKVTIVIHLFHPPKFSLISI